MLEFVDPVVRVLRAAFDLLEKLVPFLRRPRDPDPDSVTSIAGDWQVYFDDPGRSQPHGSAQIAQNGKHVTMTFGRLIARSGEAHLRTYRYQGIFRAPQLVLTWEANDQPDRRMGALVLCLTDAGKELQGLSTFYDDTQPMTSPGVRAVNYWLRKN